MVPLDGATAWRERAARSGGRARPRHVAPRWRAPSLAPASRVRGTPAAVRPPGVAPHGGSDTALHGQPAPAWARGSWRLSGAAPHSGSGEGASGAVSSGHGRHRRTVPSWARPRERSMSRESRGNNPEQEILNNGAIVAQECVPNHPSARFCLPILCTFWSRCDNQSHFFSSCLRVTEDEWLPFPTLFALT